MSDCDMSGSVRGTPSGTTHPSPHVVDNDVPAREQLKKYYNMRFGCNIHAWLLAWLRASYPFGLSAQLKGKALIPCRFDGFRTTIRALQSPHGSRDMSCHGLSLPDKH